MAIRHGVVIVSARSNLTGLARVRGGFGIEPTDRCPMRRNIDGSSHDSSQERFRFPLSWRAAICWVFIPGVGTSWHKTISSRGHDVALGLHSTAFRRTLQAWLASALLFSALTISGCDNSFFAHHFHWFQKLTVTVDTPSGRKSGDEVIEVKAEYYAKGTGIGGAARFDIAGEAGVIEVLPGKYLFVLLRGSRSVRGAHDLVSEIDLDNDFEEKEEETTRRDRGVRKFGADE